VRGFWISSKTGEPLHKIDLVFPGDRIAAKLPASEDNFISIALYDGTQTRLRCRSASDCDAGYTVPEVQKPDPFLARAARAVLQLYPTEVKKLVMAASRGPLGPEESVVEVTENGMADLGPALTAVVPGVYKAQLFSWPGAEGAQATAASGSLEWNPPVAQWKTNTRILPGLYQLGLFDENGTMVGSKVTVVAQFGPQYAKFQQAFARLKITTSGWGAADNAEVIRQFRIGFLIALWRDATLAQ
jgi:hypothetical protein